MGQIKQEIKAYIDSITEQGAQVNFCFGINPLPQQGQLCKLISGAVVQEYLVNQKFHSQKSLPLTKNKGMFDYSIRQHAKAVVDSQVGEVYGAAQMKKVFDYNNFETSSFRITDKDIYQNFILNAINQKQPVIVYFDVSPRIGSEDKQGMPSFFKGSFEHSSAIAGYYYCKSELRLIIAQWGGFYDVSFNDLFNSTSQLSASKSPEHYQKFYPIPGMFNKKMWLEKKQIEVACDYVCDNQQTILRKILSLLNYIWPIEQEREANPPEDKEVSLANVLTIIKGDQHQVEFNEFCEHQLKFENLNKEHLSCTI